MRTQYNQLTIIERSQIAALKANNFSLREIARNMNRSVATISREIRRNKAQHESYNCRQAEQTKDARKYAARKKATISSDTWSRVINMLKDGISPEQISGRLKMENEESVSHERIYQYIRQDRAQGGLLYKYLRHKGKKYKYRTKGSLKIAGRGHIPNRVDISERPLIVNKKERIGDLEIDLVAGKNHKGFILTIVDRTSKMSAFELMPDKTAERTKEHLLKALARMPIQPLTITCDNGKEFACHQEITAKTGIPVYFATPYRSCERGVNEHHNGLLREYIPKKTDFSSLTQEELDTIANRLNNRPRKVLGFYTPKEVVSGVVGVALNT